ncbi:hypothetical protein BMS3Bbin05_00351 [bacterium BMS3Bbin05]|nr:hypothetical protein BMS3Abin06_00007 [bacterium BMS3Abin06]GBE31450.1 hypothetical protein BMS3Bbin05_00351 [bacterium BMS3Bbin05]
MNYCLNSTELECLLLLHLEDKAIENVTLKSLYDNAIQWQDKLLCLTFSFARILERQRGSASLTQTMIPELFSMPEKMFIDIQECSEDFVDYMLRHEHSGEIDLEISLLTVARKLSEHCYGKNTLRD